MGVSVLPEQQRVERFLAVDERGVLLRATWRTAHGFLNVSLWRDGRCVETFHLSPKEAGRLVAFMATTLMAALPDPPTPHLRLVEERTAVKGAGRARLIRADLDRRMDRLVGIFRHARKRP